METELLHYLFLLLLLLLYYLKFRHYQNILLLYLHQEKELHTYRYHWLVVLESLHDFHYSMHYLSL